MSEKYNIKKLDIDLNNGKVTTFNPFDNKGYAVTCSKCKSTNIKYDHHNTKFNHQNKKVSVLVKCLDCDYEVTEER